MYSFDSLLDGSGLVSSGVQYRYMNFGGKAFYLAGFKEILLLSPECVVFRLKDRGQISISGENLSLQEMDTEMVMVTGVIRLVEVK